MIEAGQVVRDALRQRSRARPTAYDGAGLIVGAETRNAAGRGDRVHRDRTHRRDESPSPPGAAATTTPLASTEEQYWLDAGEKLSDPGKRVFGYRSGSGDPSVLRLRRAQQPDQHTRRGELHLQRASTTGCSPRDPSATATTKRASRRLEAASRSPGPRPAASRPTGRASPRGTSRVASSSSPSTASRGASISSAAASRATPPRARSAPSTSARSRSSPSRETGPTAISISAGTSASSRDGSGPGHESLPLRPVRSRATLRSRAEHQHVRRQARSGALPAARGEGLRARNRPLPVAGPDPDGHESVCVHQWQPGPVHGSQRAVRGDGRPDCVRLRSDCRRAGIVAALPISSTVMIGAASLAEMAALTGAFARAGAFYYSGLGLALRTRLSRSCGWRSRRQWRERRWRRR